MTFFKLSLRNARRQARDYLVYFATVALAAALLYAFHGLAFSNEVRELSALLDSLPVVVALSSAAAACVIGWLVSYTTRFLLARRGRELGLYLLIGLENRQAARLFLLENLAVGGAAFALGLLLGGLLYQVLWAVVLALFGKPYAFGLSFSPAAAGLTLAYFALIYGFAQLQCHWRLRRVKICDLLALERRNEEAALQSSRLRRWVFTGSVVLGALGTALLMLGQLAAGVAGAGCVVLGLYGFFAGFSSGVPAWFERRAARKYRGQTLLVYRGLSAKLSTMGVLMATVSLLFTATLLTEGMGLMIRALLQNRAERNGCFDLLLSTEDPSSEAFAESVGWVKERLPIRAARRYDVYLADTSEVTDFVEAGVEYYRFYDRDPLMRWSDYAALREMLGYPPVEPEPGRYWIHCEPYAAAALKHWEKPLRLGGETLRPGGISTETFAQYLYYVNGQGFLLVVPDEAAESCPVSHAIFAVLTGEPVGLEQYEALSGMLERWENAARQTGFSRMGGDFSLTLYCKTAEQAEAASMTAMAVFPLYDLAMVLTMTAAAVLTIQQLSETDRYRRQFALLRKLGMDRREMGKTLGRLFAVYYALPALPPVLIAAPILAHMGGLTEPGILTGASCPAAIIGAALGLFFLIYGLYILLAYAGFRRNVLPEEP